MLLNVCIYSILFYSVANQLASSCYNTLNLNCGNKFSLLMLFSTYSWSHVFLDDFSTDHESKAPLAS